MITTCKISKPRTRRGFPAAAVLGALSLTLLAPNTAQAQGTPPPETHNNDLYMGGDQNFGASGSGSAFWFSDASSDPNRFSLWLADTHPMIPNITGPATMGNIYFNLGTNVVTTVSGSPPVSRGVLQSATFQAVSVTPGLIVEKFGAAAFSSNSAETALGNKFNYPFSNSFHQHFNCRVFRPGLYTFSFKLTNVIARGGAALSDSPTYTLILQNRPVTTAAVTLVGWQGVDSTPYKTGNKARVFVFPAGSNPTSESQAIATTDVYLDSNGRYQMPESLVADGSYRLGIKPLTAPGLARLYPGNVALSAANPPTLAAVSSLLGDLNGDGIIDEFDYNAVVQNLYTTTSDVNGDGFTDEFDYNAVVQNLYAQSDFLP